MLVDTTYGHFSTFRMAQSKEEPTAASFSPFGFNFVCDVCVNIRMLSDGVETGILRFYLFLKLFRVGRKFNNVACGSYNRYP